MKLYPIKFKPIYKDYPWGNTRLPKRFNRSAPDGVYAESWEVSTHPDGESVIANGCYAGQTLTQLLKGNSQPIIGSAAEGAQFPLLIKLIDAAKPLSVQVHPCDANADLVDGDPKTEVWYFLNNEPAQAFCGLQPGTSYENFITAVNHENVTEVLRTVPVEKGDALYVPGGRVHAIDAGCLVLEVQETSNTTYRIYDWGRVGNDGKSRELHVEKALQVINFNDQINPLCLSVKISDGVKNICTSPFFVLNELTLRDEMKLDSGGQTFHVLFSADGSFDIHYEYDKSELVAAGTSVLVPAALGVYRITSTIPLTVLQISIPVI